MICAGAERMEGACGAEVFREEEGEGGGRGFSFAGEEEEAAETFEEGRGERSEEEVLWGEGLVRRVAMGGSSKAAASPERRIRRERERERWERKGGERCGMGEWRREPWRTEIAYRTAVGYGMYTLKSNTVCLRGPDS